jgi:hypothetical protein
MALSVAFSASLVALETGLVRQNYRINVGSISAPDRLRAASQ